MTEKITRLAIFQKKEIRKIGKNNQGTYYITIPKEVIKELYFREKQKVVVLKSGDKIMIKDWENK